MTDEPINENEFFAYVGGDALKWAQAFRQKASDLGYGDLDEGWLIGWFANAIEAGKAPLVRERDRLRELIEEIADMDIGDIEMEHREIIARCRAEAERWIDESAPDSPVWAKDRREE